MAHLEKPLEIGAFSVSICCIVAREDPMKKCVTCGKAQAEEAFNFRNKRRGIRWGTCKTCQSKQRKRWYQKNKKSHIRNVRKHKKKAIAVAQEFVWDYLSTHPCVDCGESDPVVLEFDHVRGQKRMSVSNMTKEGYSLSAIKEEIGRCEVRCANCHRRKTSEERGWFRK